MSDNQSGQEIGKEGTTAPSVPAGEAEDPFAKLEISLKEFNEKAAKADNDTVSNGTHDVSKDAEVAMSSEDASVVNETVQPSSAVEQKSSPGITIAMPPPRNIPVLTPPSNIEDHWKSVGVHRCPKCNFSTSEKTLLNNHISSCIQKPDKPADNHATSGQTSDKEVILFAFEDGCYKCLSCNLQWKSRVEFEEHVVCHVIDEPYICITCTKTFDSRPLLEKHARTTHPTGDSKCGLRGIKKAKRKVEDLEKTKRLSVLGKKVISITKAQIKKADPKLVNSLAEERTEKELDVTLNTRSETSGSVVSVLSVPVSMTKLSVIPVPSAPVPNAESSPISVISNSSSSCTLSTRQSSGFTSESMSSGLVNNALFGVINKQSNQFAPATLPVSIQKIAVPQSTTVMSPSKSGTVPYKIKDIKEYSAKPTSITQNVVPLTNPNQVLLIPVGSPVTMLGPVQQNLPIYGTAQGTPQNVQVKPISNAPTCTVVNRLPVILSRNRPLVPQPRPQGVVVAQSPPSITLMANVPKSTDVQVVSTVATPSTASSSKQKLNLDQQLSLRQHLNLEAQQVSVQQTLNARDPKKYLFRIKPGQGFVCEACRKFTRDELVFRRHVWEHFHSKPCVCKTCTPQNIAKKSVLGCQLVSNITCNLIKRSTEEVPTLGTSPASKQLADVISISDDENDEEEAKANKSHSTEVILVEDENNSDDGLQIKISSSFSLTNLTENKTLEQMTSKEDALGPTVVRISEGQMHESSSVQQSVKCKDVGDANVIDVPTRQDPLKVNTINLEKEPGNDSKTKSRTEGSNTRLNMRDSETVQQTDCMAKSAEAEVVQKSRDKIKEAITNEETEMLTAQPNMAFYICGFENCSFTCLMSSRYRSHLQEKHVSAFNYVCSHCGQKDYAEDNHLRHMFSHTNSKKFMLYTCPVRLCKYQTNILKMYKDHFVIHNVDDQSLKCVYCHNMFPSVGNFVSHLRDNLLKFINCPHCTFKCTHRSSVSKHIKSVHPDKPNLVTVTCQIVCQEREINFYVAPEGKNADIQEKSPDIDIPALLEQVQKVRMEKNEIAAGRKIMDQSPTNSKQGSVPSSPQESSKQDQSQRSQKTKEKINTSVGPKSLKCPHCSYLSHNQSYYVQHISIHDEDPQREKRFVCHICPKGLDNYHQLKRHVMNHIGRNEIKIFRCIFCSYSSNQKYHIMDHCSDNHDGKGQYVEEKEVIISNETACRYCEFRARTPEHVVQHETLVHANESGSSEKEHVSTEKYSTEPEKTVAEKEAEGMKKRKYHCDYCKGYFKHKVDLKEHMQTGHKDIESKQFTFYKCKHCSYTSTMKDCILSHFQKDHKGKQLRILRKIEKIETPKSEIVTERKAHSLTDSVKSKTSHEQKSTVSSDDLKEEVPIPDGNTFKQPFQCPKCSFSSTLRINVIRHMKSHPDLKLVRQVKPFQRPSKATARKSTSRISGENNELHKNSLIQEIPATSVPLSNPFRTVKEVVSELEKEGNSLEDYQLGEKTLHMKLFSCFKHLEEESKFKCLICKQKITKKFVLHRHILDHLKIVFFKCVYCSEGSIEQSLMTAHIQKEHHAMPVEYKKIGSAELDMQLAERISAQDFTGVEVKTLSDGSDSLMDMPGHIVKKQVHEAISIDDEPDEEEAEGEEDEAPVAKPIQLWSCDMCKYTNRRSDYYRAHMKSHSDPAKCFYCSTCWFRGTRFDVLKHLYRTLCKKQSSSCLKDKESPPSVTDDKQKSNSHTESVAQEQTGVALPSDSPKATFEMKTMFKCKECGLKRQSKSAMYHHFKTVCKSPRYQCSLCSFQNKIKKTIKAHAGLRHPGKKVTVNDLPANAKYKEIKVAVKPDELVKGNEGKSKDVNHKSLDGINQGGKYSCQICSKHVCDSVMTLQFHINTAHGGETLHCQECIYKTPLVKHMINHCTHVHRQHNVLYKLHPKGHVDNKPSGEDADTKDDVYLCPKCTYTNRRHGLVKKHLYSHFSYKPYECKHCSVRISAYCNVKRHTSTQHPGKQVKFMKVLSRDIESKIVQLSKHIKLRSGGLNLQVSGEKRGRADDEIEGPPVKKTKNDACPETIIEKEATKNGPNDNIDEAASMKYKVVLDSTGTRYFKCLMCDFKAEKKIQLRLHLANHGSRFFKCFYCDYTTKLITNASRHVEEKHSSSPMKIVNKKTQEVISTVKKTGFPSVSFDQDSLVGRSSESGTRKMKHSTLRYRCNKCPNVVEGLFHYRQHLASHSGFKHQTVASGLDSRLSCGYCAYIASDSVDFSKHISTHLDLRRLKCDYCQYSDHSKKQIRVHFRNAHPGQPESMTDTTLNRSKNIQFKIVNFDPQIVIKRYNPDSRLQKRQYKRILVETDSDSSDDNEKAKLGGKTETRKSEDNIDVKNDSELADANKADAREPEEPDIREEKVPEHVSGCIVNEESSKIDAAEGQQNNGMESGDSVLESNEMESRDAVLESNGMESGDSVLESNGMESVLESNGMESGDDVLESNEMESGDAVSNDTKQDAEVDMDVNTPDIEKSCGDGLDKIIHTKSKENEVCSERKGIETMQTKEVTEMEVDGIDKILERECEQQTDANDLGSAELPDKQQSGEGNMVGEEAQDSEDKLVIDENDQSVHVSEKCPDSNNLPTDADKVDNPQLEVKESDDSEKQENVRNVFAMFSNN